MIPEDTIGEILRRTDIVDLIGGYLPLKATGRLHKALCPFHTEKTPSFIVNPERQIFHCFGCGEGGDAITFVMKHERLTFPEAARHLAERAGVAIPTGRGGGGPSEGEKRLTLLEVQRQALEHFRENLGGPEGAPARQYLTGRGLAPALIERFQLGYALPRWDGLLRALKKRGHSETVLEAAGLIIPRQNALPAGRQGTGHYDRFRNRLMIPIWDVGGRVVGFGGRALPPALSAARLSPSAGGQVPAQAGAPNAAPAGLRPVRASGPEGEATEIKYLNSPETAIYRKGMHLYGLNLAARAIRERKRALVVEGYFDAIMLQAHGFEHAVATLGTALTTEQARLLGRYTTTVVLLFDPDAPGIGAAKRNLEHLINVELDWRIVLLPGGLDPDAYVRTRGSGAFAAALEAAQDLVDFFLDGRVSGLDMTDPLQRARAVDGLVEVVGAIDNPVRREGYIQRLAQRTPITDRALLEAVARYRGRAGRRDAAPPPVSSPVAPPSAEEQLIAIGLHFPGWRERIAAALPPEDLRDPVLRQIFTEFIRGTAAIGSQGAQARMSLLPAEVQRRLASLLIRGAWSAATPDADPREEVGPDEPAAETLERIVQDCLARIRQGRDAWQRQALRQALEVAERGGDPERILRLLAEHPSVKRDRNPR